jgi:hypothetical protein
VIACWVVVVKVVVQVGFKPFTSLLPSLVVVIRSCWINQKEDRLLTPLKEELLVTASFVSFHAPRAVLTVGLIFFDLSCQLPSSF